MGRLPLFLAAAITFAAALPAAAECRISIGKCVTARIITPSEPVERFQQARVSPPLFEVGDTLPDDYYVMINTRRYGLPPVTDGTLYFRVERRVYLADSATREILADVTHLTNRAF